MAQGFVDLGLSKSLSSSGTLGVALHSDKDNSVFLKRFGRGIYAANLSFCPGVIAPSPIFGAFVVAGPKPLGGKRFHLVDGFEEMKVEPFLSDRPVLTLDTGVLPWTPT